MVPNFSFISLSTGLRYYLPSGHGGGKQDVKVLHNADVLALHGIPRIDPSDPVQGSHCVTCTAFGLLAFAAMAVTGKRPGAVLAHGRRGMGEG